MQHVITVEGRSLIRTFLVFDNDLLTAAHEGFSHNMPSEVYIGGKKMK